MNDRILIIRTGGTIDAEPYENARIPPDVITPLPYEKNKVIPTIRELDPNGLVDECVWLTDEGKRVWEGKFVKDSAKFSPSDMKDLATIIKHVDQRHIIIAHGTNFMRKNALELQKYLVGCDKVIDFVGSMVPLSMHTQEQPSDGIPILKHALDHVRTQTPGVYLTGRDSHIKELGFFDPAKVEKDWGLSKQDLIFTLGPSR